MPKDSMYPSAPDDAAEPSTTDDVPVNNDTEEGEGADESETALVPKAFLGGDCKPGDRYTVEVVRDHEDEAEIKKIDESKEEEGETANSKLSKMGKEMPY